MSDDYPYTRTRDIVTKDIANHEMTILRDDPDSYRHIRFRRPEDGFYWFDLVTWPGVLVINGDCGTYAFSRVRDMFTFFRMHPEGPSINPSYWAQKLQAPKHRDVKHFSEEQFNKSVEQYICNWAEYHGVERDMQRYNIYDEDEGCLYPLRSEWEFRRDFTEHMMYVDGDERSMRDRLMAFDFDAGDRPFDHTWESSYDVYDFQYLWCCWAIVFGIKMYDEVKA